MLVKSYKDLIKEEAVFYPEPQKEQGMTSSEEVRDSCLHFREGTHSGPLQQEQNRGGGLHGFCRDVYAEDENPDHGRHGKK